MADTVVIMLTPNLQAKTGGNVNRNHGLLPPSSTHMTALLEQVLPGFVWLSGRGFLVGLIESFLYGAYAGLVYVPIYNFLHRKWVRQQP